MELYYPWQNSRHALRAIRIRNALLSLSNEELQRVRAAAATSYAEAMKVIETIKAERQREEVVHI